MMRTWTLRGLAALIAVAVAASAVRAAGPESPNSTEEKLNKILSQLQELDTRLNLLLANESAQRSEIDRLRADVDRLNDEMRRLSPAPTTNISASINPANPASPATPAGMGNIVLDNQYGSPASFIINGRTYRVMPFSRAVVASPPGPFVYAVATDDFGTVQGPTNRVLAPGRDFPIVVHP
jgi:outer membrane murein-binding lipoprotein Lpp